jgi:hypothetical protein
MKSSYRLRQCVWPGTLVLSEKLTDIHDYHNATSTSETEMTRARNLRQMKENSNELRVSVHGIRPTETYYRKR